MIFYLCSTFQSTFTKSTSFNFKTTLRKRKGRYLPLLIGEETDSEFKSDLSNGNIIATTYLTLNCPGVTFKKV